MDNGQKQGSSNKVIVQKGKITPPTVQRPKQINPKTK